MHAKVQLSSRARVRSSQDQPRHDNPRSNGLANALSLYITVQPQRFDFAGVRLNWTAVREPGSRMGLMWLVMTSTCAGCFA